VTASRAHSASGAFDRLLRRYPDIARRVERKVAARSRRIAKLEEVPRQISRLHAGFLARCRQEGIQSHEYPFSQKHLGERSLASHVRRLANRQFETAARAAGAQQIGHRWHADPGNVRKAATLPYEVVEFDGHKVDVRLTLRIDDPFGFETLLVLHLDSGPARRGKSRHRGLEDLPTACPRVTHHLPSRWHPDDACVSVGHR
jgi:hypothetical protein